MPDQTEKQKCRCGMSMFTTDGGARLCENCDVVQSQEPFGIARRKTPQDIRFEMSWLRTINKEYKDNTKKKGPEVGSPNSADNEGETDGNDG